MKNFYKSRKTVFSFSFIFCLFLSFSAVAQVGIGTTEPTTMLDVNGALSLRESPNALTLTNGANNGLNLGATPYSQYRITGPTESFSIDRIPQASNADGQIVRLINTTDQLMTIVHNTDGVGNRKIYCPSGTDLVLPGKYSSVTLQYSKNLQKWTVADYAIPANTSSNEYQSGYGDTNVYNWDNGWREINSLSKTFTPVNSVVFVTCYVAGNFIISNIFQQGEAQFRITSNGAEVLKTFETTGNLSGFLFPDTNYSYNQHMLPVSVTPGVPVTISVEWNKVNRGTLYNYPANNNDHIRYITIID